MKQNLNDFANNLQTMSDASSYPQPAKDQFTSVAGTLRSLHQNEVAHLQAGRVGKHSDSLLKNRTAILWYGLTTD